MYATRLTRLNWLKMTNIKDCKSHTDEICTCADKLRRLYLTKSKISDNVSHIKREIDIHKKIYNKCFIK